MSHGKDQDMREDCAYDRKQSAIDSKDAFGLYDTDCAVHETTVLGIGPLRIVYKFSSAV